MEDFHLVDPLQPGHISTSTNIVRTKSMKYTINKKKQILKLIRLKVFILGPCHYVFIRKCGITL